MFIVDGIVYANSEIDEILITKVTPLDDFMLLLDFNNNETRLFDGTKLTGEVFEPLKDEAIFKDVKLVDGVVTWQNEEIDCAPEFMYKNSFKYDKVLAI